MYEQKENTVPVGRQESRTIANSVAQKKSNKKQGVELVDNRSKSLIQRKIVFGAGSNHFSYKSVNEKSSCQNPIQTKGKIDNKKRVEEISKIGRKKIGSDIGVLRPFLGEYEHSFFFIYGLISGFTLNGIISCLETITSDKESKTNTRLINNISHEVQKVFKIDEDLTSCLGSKVVNFKDGRKAEMEGLSGELSVCARMIKSGKKVNGLGEIYNIENKSSQEVDLTVLHNGIPFFIEIAASVSKLRDKVSGGNQMEGYKSLVKSKPNTKFAYSSPDFKISNLSFEFVDKLKAAGAWLVIGKKFYSPDELQKLVGTVTEPIKKNVKKNQSSKRNRKSTGRRTAHLKEYVG